LRDFTQANPALLLYKIFWNWVRTCPCETDCGSSWWKAFDKIKSYGRYYAERAITYNCCLWLQYDITTTL